MEFELARTGKASLMIHGRLLASLFSTHSPVASVHQYRLRVIATNAGAYMLHAALGDGSHEKRYMCLGFPSLEVVSEFFAEPDNLFHAVGHRLLAMARSNEKALAKMHSEPAEHPHARALSRRGLGEAVTA